MKNTPNIIRNKSSYSLAFLIQQMEQTRRLLADEVDAAGVVDVVDVVPANSFCSIFLLKNPQILE